MNDYKETNMIKLLIMVSIKSDILGKYNLYVSAANKIIYYHIKTEKLLAHKFIF